MPPSMRALIRYDWSATEVGFYGGLDRQRAEFKFLKADSWEQAQEEVSKSKEVNYLLKRPIHPFDGEFLTAVVLMEDKPQPWRVCSWNRV